MITSAQKAVLHIAKAQLGLEDEYYRAILREQAGVTSSTDLTNGTFDAVMVRLEELGFKNTARKPLKRRKAEPNALITPEQQQLLRTLYEQAGMTTMDRQMGFAKRCCRRSFPQSRTDANKVIEGLKAMIKRQAAK